MSQAIPGVCGILGDLGSQDLAGVSFHVAQRKGLGEKKEGRGNQNPLCISVASFELRRTLQPELPSRTLFPWQPLTACKTVTAHSGPSVAEPENGRGEVLFPGLLA